MFNPEKAARALVIAEAGEALAVQLNDMVRTIDVSHEGLSLDKLARLYDQIGETIVEYGYPSDRGARDIIRAILAVHRPSGYPQASGNLAWKAQRIVSEYSEVPLEEEADERAEARLDLARAL